MITWNALLHSLWRLFELSFRIVFRRKLLFMTGGVLAYYGILYALAVFRPGEGFSVEQALHVLVETPGAVLAIYLTMDLVAGERDRDTLETLFSTASSHYAIWSVRLVCVYALLGVSLGVMSVGAYFLFAEFPVLLGALNALLPALLMANLTFLFSVVFRSSNTAGMLSLAVLILVLLTADTLSDTSYALFMSPFDLPMGTDAWIWQDRLLMNRAAILLLCGLLLFSALRRMERRERLLS